MKKKMLAVLLAAIMILGFMPQSAKADETYPDHVTVYLSISDGAEYVQTTGTYPQVMALVPIEVSYFDLGQYGLNSFYFNRTANGYYEPANYYTPESDLTPGDAQSSAGVVTMLHVLIYAMEHFYLGEDDEDCGQGALLPYMTLVDEYDSTRSYSATATELVKISGTPGSLYFDKYWDFAYPSDNLNYFVDYKYPLASTGTENGTGYGWGATADQIPLTGGEIITLAHFPTEGQYLENEGLFAHASFVSTEDGLTTLQFNNAWVDFGITFETTDRDYLDGQDVYYCNLNNLSSGDVTTWTYLGQINGDELTFTTSILSSGNYIIAVAGVDGSMVVTDTVCAPGGMLWPVQ